MIYIGWSTGAATDSVHGGRARAHYSASRQNLELEQEMHQ